MKTPKPDTADVTPPPEFSQGSPAPLIEPVYRIPGYAAATVAFALKPTPEQCRTLLRDMRARGKLSRGQLAALMGCDTYVVRRWEEGTRVPSASARRLIQLLEVLYFHPERIGAFMPNSEVLVALFRERGDIKIPLPLPA